MCGINGIVTSDYSLQKKIKNLNILLKHRGPDDEGFVAIDRSNGKFIQYSGDSSIEKVKHNHPHISNLANGYYFLQINFSQGKKQVLAFVKN